MIETDADLDRVIDALRLIREKKTGLPTSRKKIVDILCRAAYARELCR